MNDPSSLPILSFHGIDRSGSITSTTPDRFAQIIDRLTAAGFRGVDLAGWIAQGRPPVDRGFAIAFDDGLASILDVVDLLTRRSSSATIFLVGDRIGGDNDWPGQPAWVPRARTLDRSEIGGLLDLGFGFGSHGRTHARLDRLEPPAIEAELVGSRDRIEQIVDRPCPLLAYPYGSQDARVRRLAAGVYEAAFGTRLGYASNRDHTMAIGRIDAFYLRSDRALDRLIEGRWRPHLAVRRNLRAARRAFAGAIEAVPTFR